MPKISPSPQKPISIFPSTYIMTHPYRVNFWGSHPDLNQDDLRYGRDFATREEAVSFFHHAEEEVYTEGAYRGQYMADEGVAYLELDGLTEEELQAKGLERYKKNPRYRRPSQDTMWEQEARQQAGMLGGIEAYNDF